MIDRNLHLAGLREVAEGLSKDSVDQNSALLATVALYGFRVMAASEAYYPLAYKARMAQAWDLAKRETIDMGALLNRHFQEMNEGFNILALKYQPDYRTFRDDRLTRAVLMLDRTPAAVGGREDVVQVGRTLETFFAQQTRYPNADLHGLTTLPFLNILAAQLLAETFFFRTMRSYSVHDPACGFGGSLVALSHVMPSVKDVSFSGQDESKAAVFVAAWNLLLAGAVRIDLQVGDSLIAPQFTQESELDRFDVVISQPPPHYVDTYDFGDKDLYRRFRYGSVLGSRADYAFVQHIISSIAPKGQAAVILSATALSRAGFEEKIRANLVHADIIEAVITFRETTLLSKDTPAALLLINLNKREAVQGGILFIEANGGESYLTLEDPSDADRSAINQTVDIVGHIQTKLGTARLVRLDELQAREYSLAPQAYIMRQVTYYADTEALDKDITTAAQAFLDVQSRAQKALTALRKRRVNGKMDK